MKQYFQQLGLETPLQSIGVDMRAATAIFALLSVSAQAATLEKLSLDDMIAKSTAIVRGKVLGSATKQHGQTIYTHYRITVSEVLKGDGSAAADVVVAGGQMGRLRQTFPGSPVLEPGPDYVFCLWTGKQSGLTHIIGLTQGLFTVTRDAKGEAMLSRGASAETMLDGATGKATADQGVRMQMAEFSRRVRQQASSSRVGQ